jgi:fatty acid desaturase
MDASSDTLGIARQHPPAEVRSLIRPLSKRDNWINWLYLAADWLTIAGAVALHLLVPGFWLYVLAVIIIGSRLRALGNLLHEAAHFKLFAHRGLNNFAGRLLCAWPIFVSYQGYVADHVLHHRNLWRNDQDPDLALYALTRTERSAREAESFALFLAKHVLLVVIPVMPAWRLACDASRKRSRLATVCAVGIAGIVLTALGPSELASLVVSCWIVPWFTSFQCIAYWAELAEHGGLASFGWHWGSRNWTAGIVTRWVVGSHSDDLYHLLHHWFPAVPHYRLRLLDGACQSAWPEYREQLRCTGFFRAAGAGVSVMRDIWSGGTWTNHAS